MQQLDLEKGIAQAGQARQQERAECDRREDLIAAVYEEARERIWEGYKKLLDPILPVEELNLRLEQKRGCSSISQTVNYTITGEYKGFKEPVFLRLVHRQESSDREWSIRVGESAHTSHFTSHSELWPTLLDKLSEIKKSIELKERWKESEEPDDDEDYDDEDYF